MTGVRPVVSNIVNDSVAAEAQITTGMEIKAVDGIETSDWDDVRMALISKIGSSSIKLTVSKFGDNATQQKLINLYKWQVESNQQDPVFALGIRSFSPQIEMALADVQANPPTSSAGLQTGDRIIKVDGQLLTQWKDFAEQVRDNPGKKMTLEVERNDKTITFTLMLEAKLGNEGFVGVVPCMIPLPDHYKIVRQLWTFSIFWQSEY